MARYWGLFVKDDGHWSYEFGSYDKSDVTSEQEDWLDHYDDQGKKRRKVDTRIEKWEQCPDDLTIISFRNYLQNRDTQQ